MGDTAGPDRSSVEVKALLRKLDPKTGSSHKDRVRLLNRFRNYAEGGGGGKGDVSVICVVLLGVAFRWRLYYLLCWFSCVCVVLLIRSLSARCAVHVHLHVPLFFAAAHMCIVF